MAVLPLASDEGGGEGEVGGADGRLDDHEGAGRHGPAPELGQGGEGDLKKEVQSEIQ